MNDCDNWFTPLRKREILFLRFSGVAMMNRRENTEPALDSVRLYLECPVLPDFTLPLIIKLPVGDDMHWVLLLRMTE